MSNEEIENSETKILKNPSDSLKNDAKKQNLDKISKSKTFDFGFPKTKHKLDAFENQPSVHNDFPNDDVALEEENVK